MSEGMLRGFVVCTHPILIPNRFLIPLSTLVRVSDPKGRDVTHMFFTIRSIDYTNACQLEDPANDDYKKASTQTAEDEGKLEKWLNYVNANKRREEPVGPDMFDFSFMKDRYESSEFAFTVPSMSATDKFR